MTLERIEELRRLVESGSSVMLNAQELGWLFDTQDRMRVALRGLFETHVAIDPPTSGPCHECLAAIEALDSLPAS
jgi:hypothetical protein